MAEVDSASKIETSIVSLSPDGQSEGNPPRAIAFPHEATPFEEKLPTGGIRPKGVEMNRTLTKEEKELADAGYGRLEEQKAIHAEQDLGHVDITEHAIPLNDLNDKLSTSVDVKDPGNSNGLTSDEAKQRLAKNGPNILTPPKKKSALRKVPSFRKFSQPDSNPSS